jgi:hypothetical protein
MKTLMKTLDQLQNKLSIEMEIGINQKNMIAEVVRYVKEDNMTHMEALLQVSEDHNIEPEDLARLVKGNLKDRVYAEAVQLNCIKGEAPVNTLY